MVNKPKCHKMSRVVTAAGLFVVLLITACDSTPAVTSDTDAKAKSSNGAAVAPPANTKTVSPNKTGTLTPVTPNGPKRLEVKRAGAPGAPSAPVLPGATGATAAAGGTASGTTATTAAAAAAATNGAVAAARAAARASALWSAEGRRGTTGGTDRAVCVGGGPFKEGDAGSPCAALPG